MPSERKTLWVAVTDDTQDATATVADIAPLTYSIQTVTPVTLDTVTVNSGRSVLLVVNPAGTIAALTINMASSPAPTNGDLVTVTATQIVTSLTMAGGTILGALSAFAVASFASWRYHASIAKWLRVG